MTWLGHQVRARPEATALRVDGRVFSYGELGRRVGRAAGLLAQAGIGPGDRVAVALPNSLELLLVIHAAPWLGAALVPIDPRLATVDPAEVGRRLEEAGASVLVTPRQAGAAAAGGHDHPPPCPTLEAEELATASEASTAPVPPPHPQRPDALHSIVFTSGSTGRAEAVHLTHGNHTASAAASAFNLGIDRRDDWLCCLPLVHVGGLATVLRSTLYGTAVTVEAGFDAARVAEHLRSGRITLASLVPTMLRRLLALDEPLVPEPPDPATAPGLRAILLGGGPADPSLIDEAVARRGLPVLATYGMTETASQVATVAPERLEAIRRGDEPAGAAGRPLPGAEIGIRVTGGDRGDRKQAAKAGEIGEIWVRGPMVSASSAGPDGWLRTGDLGRFDAAGNLWVTGRRDQVIVTGGENVSSERVEAVLSSHPDVEECAVTGLDDPEWGRLVAAAIVPCRPDEPPETAQLVAWCRGRLAPYEVPKRWSFVPGLPRTAAGKVRRASVTALFEVGPPGE